MQVVASDDEDEEIDSAGTELLDNLTFITSKGVIGGVEDKTDWETGIHGGKLGWRGVEGRPHRHHQDCQS